MNRKVNSWKEQSNMVAKLLKHIEQQRIEQICHLEILSIVIKDGDFNALDEEGKWFKSV